MKACKTGGKYYLKYWSRSLGRYSYKELPSLNMAQVEQQRMENRGFKPRIHKCKK